MKCYTSSFISFVWQRYGKRHEKALGKARKSGAEGVKLLKESGAIFFVHNLFVFYFIFLNRANSSSEGAGRLQFIFISHKNYYSCTLVKGILQEYNAQ